MGVKINSIHYKAFRQISFTDLYYSYNDGSSVADRCAALYASVSGCEGYADCANYPGYCKLEGGEYNWRGSNCEGGESMENANGARLHVIDGDSFVECNPPTEAPTATPTEAPTDAPTAAPTTTPIWNTGDGGVCTDQPVIAVVPDGTQSLVDLFSYKECPQTTVRLPKSLTSFGQGFPRSYVTNIEWY